MMFIDEEAKAKNDQSKLIRLVEHIVEIDDSATLDILMKRANQESERERQRRAEQGFNHTLVLVGFNLTEQPINKS